jgi:hypothetical protein
MELKNIFYDLSYRNIFIKIVSYLSYDEICNILYLDKLSKEYIKYILRKEDNYNILIPIHVSRFFDRKGTKLYINDDIYQPSSTINNMKSFWKRYYPWIDHGDIIYLKQSDKFVKISSELIFVRHCMDRKDIFPMFPIDYWREIGKEHPFRLWIVAKVFYDTFEVWMKDVNIRFIDVDLSKLCDSKIPIEIYFTYVEDIIYIYKGRD